VLLQAAATQIRYLQDRRDGITPKTARETAAEIRGDLHRLRSGDTAASAGGVDRRIHDLYPLRYLGELALLEGQVSAAVELFEQALELDPAYSFAWLGMAECSRFAGDRKRAMKLYLRTVTESEWNHRAWFRGCDLMTEMGFHDNADSWLRNAVRRFPEHPQAVAERALAPGAASPVRAGA
jgi:tetratricopeptide (TPR) repeat protein